MANLKRFFLCFAHEYVDFRLPEIKSLIKFFDLNIALDSVVADKPYWILDNVSEKDLQKIASRSVSLRYVMEIYGEGKNYDTFHEHLRQFKLVDTKLLSPESSFRITVETFNKHIKHNEKIQRIESMDYLPLNGRIDLKNPESNLIYYEFWGSDPKTVPHHPEEIVFGRWVNFLFSTSVSFTT